MAVDWKMHIKCYSSTDFDLFPFLFLVQAEVYVFPVQAAAKLDFHLQVTWDSVGSNTSEKPDLENIGFAFLTLLLCHLEADLHVFLNWPPYFVSDFRLH